MSVGLEGGWLAFVCGPRKRRLAPFPSEWQSADATELERLCGQARAARATGLEGGNVATARPAGADPAPRAPRIRTSRASRAIGTAGDLPIVATATSARSVEETVREFAHQARLSRMPAIEAMVQLKALLARVYADESSGARDVRAVRRWFVDAYYFERRDTPADEIDQAR